MSKQPPPAPTVSAVGPCPTVIQIVGRPGTGSLPSTIAPPDHPTSKRRLMALLKDASVWKNDYLDILSTIEENCQLCKSYTKTPPRPVVSLPMAHEFNEKVAMESETVEGALDSAYD